MKHIKITEGIVETLERLTNIVKWHNIMIIAILIMFGISNGTFERTFSSIMWMGGYIHWVYNGASRGDQLLFWGGLIGIPLGVLCAKSIPQRKAK